MTICKAREYDFLDFRNEKFNTDFVDFNRKVFGILECLAKRKTQVDLLRETLRKKLEATYKDLWDTPHAFQYLARLLSMP